MSSRTLVGSSQVRPFAAEHIPEVADLHRRVFGIAANTSQELLEEYRRYFYDVFLAPPAQTDRTGPLVYCDGSRVTGFLGVTSRPMSFYGKRVQACVSSQFIVDPCSRGPAGIALLRTFFNGPQDISLADESTGSSRRLWEALGGATSLVHSMQWICPVQPSRFAMWAAAQKGRLGAAFSQIAWPAAAVVDMVASRTHVNPFRVPVPRVTGEELDPEGLSACLSEFAVERPLHPRYDERLVHWLLDRAKHMPRQGRLHKVLVRSERRQIAGWYIYYANRRGLGEVLQLFASRDHVGSVLDHLLHHARQHGAVALRGRCEPGLVEPLSERHWPCCWGPWLLVHSNRSEILSAFQRGDAFFSRLDGEWCAHLR